MKVVFFHSVIIKHLGAFLSTVIVPKTRGLEGDVKRPAWLEPISNGAGGIYASINSLSPLILNNNRGVGVDWRDRKPFFPKKNNMLLHSPSCLIDAILNRMSDSAKTLQVRGVKTEIVRLSVASIINEYSRSIIFTCSSRVLDPGGLEDGVTCSRWGLLWTIIVHTDESIASSLPMYRMILSP
jgi:hypothetical protein